MPDPDLSRVILCADLPYPGYDKLKKLETALRRDTPHIGWRSVWPMANHCAGLPPTGTYPPHPIKAPGLPPVLIAGGTYDDNTPTGDGRRLAAQLPGARFLTAAGGHALYFSGHPCVREHVHRYFTTGELPPRGASCGPAK
jgi:pimeloyl-ACP methyl ester carboxylesterase